jgi:hypothetical protein
MIQDHDMTWTTVTLRPPIDVRAGEDVHMTDDVTAAILLDIESPFWRQWAADTIELLARQEYDDE